MTPEEKKIKRKIYREKHKDDIAIKKKIWDKLNKENEKVKRKIYTKNNVDKIKIYQKKYKQNNKTKINAYYKNKLETDKLYKLKYNTKLSVLKALKRNGFSKKSKTTQILGCSYENFKQHLENKFQPWMNWNNHGLYNGTEGYGWDIDHIIPISSATNEIELLKLCHYSNLQPLCSYINRVIKRDLVI